MHTKTPENVRESIVTGNGSVVVINPWGWGALGRSRGTAEGTRRRGGRGSLHRVDGSESHERIRLWKVLKSHAFMCSLQPVDHPRLNSFLKNLVSRAYILVAQVKGLSPDPNIVAFVAP